MNKNKYYPIYEDLKYKIQHGEYKENEKFLVKINYVISTLVVEQLSERL
ncbi:hypothetical protein PBN90_09860 [Enterococcus faecalis]|nr:hypothetical protein [Enterococcus faecalis]MDH4720580.1 hypothetical protein [Enterococcus faecalis]